MIARRRMIEIAAGCAALFSLGGAGRAATLPPTPRQTAGPFYPLSIPRDSDNDLVQVTGHNGTAQGTVSYVSGHILDPDGRPLSGARVEIWQCDTNGRYHYVRDDRADTPLDENFQGYGQVDHRRKGRLPLPHDPARALSWPHPSHPLRGFGPGSGALHDPDVHRRRAAQRARRCADGRARPRCPRPSHRAPPPGSRARGERSRRHFRHRARLNRRKRQSAAPVDGLWKRHLCL